jgi:diguanylate cyclase (GGDEF)-like protein
MAAAIIAPAFPGIAPAFERLTMSEPVLNTDLQDFIARLDAAEQAHLEWSHRLLRCSLMKTSPGEDVLAENAHTRCAFGAWLLQHMRDFESIEPTLTQQLEEEHECMHDAARSICKGVLSGAPGDTASIDAFEQAQSGMIAHLSVLRAQCLANGAQLERKLAETALAKTTNKLLIANEELAYQSDEKDKRAAELVVANVELAYQSDEKDKRAAELVVANVELVKNKKISDDVWKLAFYDALTNLPNRRLFNDRMGQAMAASNRSQGKIALMMLDLDNFKPLNDTHGHVVGDLLLVEVGKRLKTCVREVDTVARFGGDEFVVMLTNLAEAMEEAVGHAVAVAEKIRGSLAAPYELITAHTDQANHWVEHRCSVSIGVVVFVDHKATPEDVLKLADAAMYQAKSAGRNTIRFHQGPLKL